jgi:hypothetical protein
MKNILLALTLGTLLASCSKSSTSTTPTNNNTTPTIPTDGWTFNGTSHKQVYCLRQTNQFCLNAVDATTGTINSFAAFFKAYPVSNGTYHIVAFSADSSMTYPGAKIGANDVIIVGSVPKTSGSGDDSYWSIGTEAKDATVTITNGKLKIEVPEVKVVKVGGTGADTAKITGTMVEN